MLWPQPTLVWSCCYENWLRRNARLQRCIRCEDELILNRDRRRKCVIGCVRSLNCIELIGSQSRLDRILLLDRTKCRKISTCRNDSYNCHWIATYALIMRMMQIRLSIQYVRGVVRNRMNKCKLLWWC